MPASDRNEAGRLCEEPAVHLRPPPSPTDHAPGPATIGSPGTVRRVARVRPYRRVNDANRTVSRRTERALGERAVFQKIHVGAPTRPRKPLKPKRIVGDRRDLDEVRPLGTTPSDNAG